MASIPGGQYVFAQGGQQVNVVTSPDGQNLPPPVTGEFNLEVVTGGVVPSAGLAPGYQGMAVLSDNGQTINMAYGDWSLQLNGDPTVIGGTGSDTIYGGNGPALIVGGT